MLVKLLIISLASDFAESNFFAICYRFFINSIFLCIHICTSGIIMYYYYHRCHDAYHRSLVHCNSSSKSASRTFFCIGSNKQQPDEIKFLFDQSRRRRLFPVSRISFFLASSFPYITFYQV